MAGSCDGASEELVLAARAGSISPADLKQRLLLRHQQSLTNAAICCRLDTRSRTALVEDTVEFLVSRWLAKVAAVGKGEVDACLRKVLIERAVTWARMGRMSEDSLAAGLKAEFEDNLCRYCRRAVGRLRSEEGGVADTSILDFIRHVLPRFRSQGPGAVFACLRKVFLLRWREQMRRESAQSPDPVETTEPDDPSLLAEQKELKAMIEHCLDRLPERQKVVIVLRDRCDLVWQHIADMLGVCVNTARAAHRLGLVNLRRCLATEMGGTGV